MKRLGRIGLTLGLILTMTASAWPQCAMCRTGLTQSPEGQRMARGFHQAILFLLVAPYLLVSTVAFQILRLQARARGTTVWGLLGLPEVPWGRHRFFRVPRETSADDSAGGREREA